MRCACMGMYACVYVAGSVRRRRAANISEEGKTGAVAMYTMLSSRESDVSLQQPSPTSSAASET